MSWPRALTDVHSSLVILALALTIGAALRLTLAFHDDGIYWPDEIYQSLEPAHRLVFGFGLVPWEFIDGARNWTFPGLIAGILETAVLLGHSEPQWYLGLVRLFFCAIGVATALATFWLARSYGTSLASAAVGAALFALAAPAIYFAPRAMAETASALPVALGLALALKRDARSRDRMIGAALLGLAVLLRLQNAIFCLGLLGILAARRQPRAVAQSLSVLTVIALFFGLLDRLTWGEWFRSAFVYLEFNLFGGHASLWGTEPVTQYVASFMTAMAPVALLIIGFALLGSLRAAGLALTVLVFLLLHSLVPHKEFRFIMPALPLLCALAAVGLDSLRVFHLPRSGGDGKSRRPLWTNLRVVYALAAVAVLVGATTSGMNYRHLTFGDLGQYLALKPYASALDDHGPTNRLLLVANSEADLCGLKVADHLVWTGGYTYLHRNVPLYPVSGPPIESGFYNYVIAERGHPPQGEVRATDADRVLVRLPGQECNPDPGYDWRLP